MNRLADETSPYLRQHAANPVDWRPWGPEAFEDARRRDVPIFLSVGYSACHWCHVMAHESFEDPDTAAVVNELFVSVKVDREERPDVDAVYMEATQAMTGSGGWPMTVFMTPDGEPFFCGTYFPKQSLPGRPGFVDLCRAIGTAWRERRAELLDQAGSITAHLRSSSLPRAADGATHVPGRDVLDTALTLLLEQHDAEWGGFGQAPKFPQTMSLELLLRAHARSGGPAALSAVTTSLDAMAAGGIYDHIGGGFARYSVDPVWLVPHFEKMLYDQALLARVYLHGWQVTGEPRHLQVLSETVAYVRRDLRHAEGGFFSAEDADASGVEGSFTVWTPAQVRAELGDRADAAMAWWDISESGNFEGASIPNRMHARGQLARPPEIDDARELLLAARERRVRPGLDDKVLTEWNGLMIATLAEAGAATATASWVEAAEAAGDFLLRSLRRDDGRWLRSWQAEGGARHLAFAADHAALVDAFTRLAEATGHARWIDEARATADALIDRFWDGGGFATTGDDGEELVARAKDLMDTAAPSANSLAATSLLRLAALTGVERYRDHAHRVLALLGPMAGQHPTAFANLLAAVDMVDAGITEVAVVGDAPDLVDVVQRTYLPNAVLAWGEPYDSPLWDGRSPGHAYVCRDYACQAPVTTTAELRAQLEPDRSTSP